MGAFIEADFEFANNDNTIVAFTNFWYFLHIKVGCESQGYNFN